MSRITMKAGAPAQADTAGDQLREATSRLLTPPVRADLADGAFPAALWAAIEELGLPASLLPQEAGGLARTDEM